MTNPDSDTPATIRTVGFVGLGLLGSALSGSLIDDGYDVRGFDISTDRMTEFQTRGGTPADSAAAAADGADVVMTCLMTNDIVEQVVEGGIAESIRPGIPVIDASTVNPDRTAALAGRLAARGTPMLDTAISGSSRQAAARDVLILVGGDSETFASCRHLIEPLGRKTLHLGPCGAGVRAKLVVNLVLGLNRAALAEGLIFAEALGLSPADALDVLRESSAYSRVMGGKGDKMVGREFSPEGKLTQHLKDVGLILELAGEHSAPLLLSSLHQQLLRSAVARGHGDDDNSAIIEAIRALTDLGS